MEIHIEKHDDEPKRAERAARKYEFLIWSQKKSAYGLTVLLN
jgi:hypothetical protein